MAGFLFVCASGWNSVKSGRLSYFNNLKSWFTVSLPQGADIPSEKGDTDAYKTQNFLFLQQKNINFFRPPPL